MVKFVVVELKLVIKLVVLQIN